MPTKLCHDTTGLEAHGRFVLTYVEELLEYRVRKPFRDMRFKRYVARQKAKLCQGDHHTPSGLPRVPVSCHLRTTRTRPAAPPSSPDISVFLDLHPGPP